MVGSVEGLGVIGGRLADFFSLGPVSVNIRTRRVTHKAPRVVFAHDHENRNGL
jgi:hypothetical protein